MRTTGALKLRLQTLGNDKKLDVSYTSNRIFLRQGFILFSSGQGVRAGYVDQEYRAGYVDQVYGLGMLTKINVEHLKGQCHK